RFEDRCSNQFGDRFVLLNFRRKSPGYQSYKRWPIVVYVTEFLSTGNSDVTRLVADQKVNIVW
ncbi:MAG: hypothetical protein DMC59_09200, partial [Verrucomicrobia bacterium]